MTQPGIEPKSPGPLVNTLPTRPIWKFITVFVKIKVGKRFSWVPTHQRPILALVYPWYTNMEQNGRKDKINTIVHTWTFNLLYTYS